MLANLLLEIRILLSALTITTVLAQTPTAIENPILFVTQVPVPADFTTIGSVFGNHLAEVSSAARGGDLWIRYPDGTLKNLTAEAGFGMVGFQGADAIAVRDPAVHWSGEKAVFSMVIGAPTQQFRNVETYWQLYEVTGWGAGETPIITRVPNQPEQYNNISPTYGTDDRIIFTSDRTRNGERHLYPQLDEYEEAPTVSGLWSLDPVSGDLFLLDHAPSGVFTPIVDSFGRVIFTRWDHLQRDQQADGDALDGNTYGTFDYSDESADAQLLFGVREEFFPEPRGDRADLLAGTPFEGHRFNLFFPWMMHEDGSGHETLNHIGRHELHDYFNRSRDDDPDVEEFILTPGIRHNENPIENLLQVKEDPKQPGLYFGVDAPEFSTHAAGQIVTLSGTPNLPGDQMEVTYVTHRDTADYTDTPGPDHSGLYREPLPLVDGSLVALHTPVTTADRNSGSRAEPRSLYDFRLKALRQSGTHWVADQPLTQGIEESVTWWDPDVRVTYAGLLWELNPVEVRARPRPERLSSTLDAPESRILEEEGVAESLLRGYLRERGLALVVSRNVTTRDEADRQQPFNLRVNATETKTVGSDGAVYDVSYLQFFQADQVRGIGLFAPDDTPRSGRRVLARPLHDPAVDNPSPAADLIPGAVQLGNDGSMAAFVAARRAMTWQLTDAAGTPVVRERYWLTFQPGEIRTCASCHGLNSRDQAGGSVPANPPEALRGLLRYWKSSNGSGEEVVRPRVMRLSNQQVEIRWPNRFPDLSLESSTDLASPVWNPISNSPTAVGDEFSVIVESNERQRFFRLK